jgi:hypothetical protein
MAAILCLSSFSIRPQNFPQIFFHQKYHSNDIQNTKEVHMGRVDITYQEMQNKYPEHASAILNEIRSSKSASRNTPIEDIVWCIRWSTIFREGGIQQHAGFSFQAKAGRISREWPVHNMPDEIQSFLNKQAEDRAEEIKMIESLSPEERNERLQESLSELRKCKGFMEFK